MAHRPFFKRIPSVISSLLSKTCGPTRQMEFMEFIRRFLQHVLPKGFQRVRYYGWLGPAAKTRWQRILALLDFTPPPLILLPRPEPLCRRCGKKLCWIGTLERAPP